MGLKTWQVSKNILWGDFRAIHISAPGLEPIANKWQEIKGRHPGDTLIRESRKCVCDVSVMILAGQKSQAGLQGIEVEPGPGYSY